MTEAVKQALLFIPNKPGVYLMKNKDDEIIYVGKAKSLNKRVTQYFMRPQSGKVAAMVFNVDHFETIITKSEKEAFILEMNLIKKHYPRYNILLKDSKHYPYIALKRKNAPVLKIARDDKDKNYFYFGPYPTSSHAYEMISLLNKIFPLQKCRTLPNVPCLYYHLGQCLAPCINRIDEETHALIFSQIKSFLSGNNADVISQIKQKMESASANQEYETANEYKTTLQAIEHINQPQSMEVKDHIDRDIFAYVTRDGYLALALLTFRQGILLGKEVFVVEQFGENLDLVADLILQYYQTHSLPQQIIANIYGLKARIEEIYDIKVIYKSRGALYDLVDMASVNARQGLDEHFMTARLTDNNLGILTELAKTIGIKTPTYIELFDNSHLQGASPVGAMVAFINGEPAKKMYRKFHIEGEEKRDDFASMNEVVFRRYKRLKDDNLRKPDLVLVDGGLPQVNAANEALSKVELSIPVFGLYKNDRHQTEGLIDANGIKYDLQSNKPLFFLLMRMQDEVHRFAISFHHQVRNKTFKASILDNIEGLGKRRIEILYRNYESINELKKATLEELEQLLPKNVALRVKERLEQ
ncbi:MAG: excinuclease ABC subunit UvrC [Bacilli bacterium]|nr:excinuclease ABC subunit UvrC [Bacilli bacterium]